MVAYAILSPKGQIAAVKEYRSKSPLSIQDMLGAALEQDTFLKQRFAKVRVLVGIQEFTLVPAAHFDRNQVKRIATALLKDRIDLDEVGSHELPRQGAHVVHTYPLALAQKLRIHFPEAKVEPACVSLIGLAEKLSLPGHDTLLLHVLDHEAVLVGLKGGQLALCNSYPWHTPTDLLYFGQLAFDLMSTEPPLCNLFLTGAFETGSDLDRTVRQHLPTIAIPSDPLKPLFEVQGDKLPLWKYAYLGC
jgi:hypothetical protein